MSFSPPTPNFSSSSLLLAWCAQCAVEAGSIVTVLSEAGSIVTVFS